MQLQLPSVSVIVRAQNENKSMTSAHTEQFQNQLWTENQTLKTGRYLSLMHAVTD